MKKMILFLILLIALSGCLPAPQPVREESSSVPEMVVAPVTPVTPISSSKEEEEIKVPAVYKPDKGMTAEAVISAYFEQQYLAYATFTDIDLSAIIDMHDKNNQNMVNWIKMLNHRRRLIAENNFCYVETKKFPYTIQFEQEPDDQRMQVWSRRLDIQEYTILHFRIDGEPGKAYPPNMAINSQHSMVLKQVDGEWKITMHYFPGSRRKYGIGTVTVPPEHKMLADLKSEFSQHPETGSPDFPQGALRYDSRKAVDYAKKYTEVKNPSFHDIGDWGGNCANFVSQSVWAGFGSVRTTSEWNDGVAAWNHVGYFWEYITRGTGLGGYELTGVSELKNGDIVQTRSLSNVDEPDRFTHELIVVDEKNLKLAQNTPATFVYYSDLVNTQTRIIRPLYLR